MAKKLAFARKIVLAGVVAGGLAGGAMLTTASVAGAATQVKDAPPAAVQTASSVHVLICSYDCD
ncbi:hypothetical protein OG943_16695 [Amycolatopsis sp. NBC_00345]|uniref:hypothetical protein n=1 Tax=Amycolatopsis sp. NBC_00345 TaxID=2975955 RepID=UPI002E2532FB